MRRGSPPSADETVGAFPAPVRLVQAEVPGIHGFENPAQGPGDLIEEGRIAGRHVRHARGEEVYDKPSGDRVFRPAEREGVETELGGYSAASFG